MDGLQWPLKSKFALGFCVASVYSILAFFGTFYWKDDAKTVIQIADSMKIELVSMRTSSYRVLAIFLWKQTIMSVWKKSQATIICYLPYIEWKSTESGSFDFNLSVQSNVYSFTNND